MPMNFRLVVDEGLLTRHYDFANQILAHESPDFWAMDESTLYLAPHLVFFKTMARETSRPYEKYVVLIPLSRVLRIVVTGMPEAEPEEESFSDTVKRIADGISKGKEG